MAERVKLTRLEKGLFMGGLGVFLLSDLSLITEITTSWFGANIPSLAWIASGTALVASAGAFGSVLAHHWKRA